MSVVKMPPRKQPTASLPITEDSLAVVFAHEHGEQAVFDHHSGKWFTWAGARWSKSDTGLPIEWVRELCRAYAAQDEPLAGRLGKAVTIRGIEALAKHDRRIAVTSEEFDRDPMRLATPGGTVDLYTGELGEARPRDLITRSAAVAPASSGEDPHRWLQFLSQCCGEDEELVRFLQIVAGYCLTGLTTEHALFFVFGPGGNGKSVFLNTISGIMGDYAATAPMEAFTANVGERHSTEVAMLRGARLVSASETEEGRPWAESRIKQLTGGDAVTARFMRRDFFTFKPAFKLLIIGNHKPVLRNVDDAARRRFRLIPFIIQPAEPNPNLEAELREEWPAILRWMIEGCLLWQGERLGHPAAVTAATEGYFEDQDLLAQWLTECCDADKMPIRGEFARRCPVSKLYASWKSYAEKAGDSPGSSKAFSQAMERRGFPRLRTKVAREMVGVSLKQERNRVTDDA